MAAKFRRIDEQRKNEPLIKDFLYSPLTFDVPSRARTHRLSRFARFSRARGSPAFLMFDRLQRSSIVWKCFHSTGPGRPRRFSLTRAVSAVHLTSAWRDSRSRQIGRFWAAVPKWLPSCLVASYMREKSERQSDVSQEKNGIWLKYNNHLL